MLSTEKWVEQIVWRKARGAKFTAASMHWLRENCGPTSFPGIDR